MSYESEKMVKEAADCFFYSCVCFGISLGLCAAVGFYATMMTIFQWWKLDAHSETFTLVVFLALVVVFFLGGLGVGYRRSSRVAAEFCRHCGGKIN
jgi:hypothetical protein